MHATTKLSVLSPVIFSHSIYYSPSLHLFCLRSLPCLEIDMTQHYPCLHSIRTQPTREPCITYPLFRPSFSRRLCCVLPLVVPHVRCPNLSSAVSLFSTRDLVCRRLLFTFTLPSILYSLPCSRCLRYLSKRRRGMNYSLIMFIFPSFQ